jgi:NitT/TauT family transport system substrate-binding protein
MSRRPVWSGALLAAVLALALVACSPAGQGQEELREVTFLVPFPSEVSFFPIPVAEEMGYFAEEGLTVEILGLQGSGAVLQQIISGQSDIGATDPGLFATATIEGTADGHITVFTLNQHLVFRLVRLAGQTEISDVSDLAGQTIGVSELTGGEMPVLQGALAAEGIDPETDVEIIEVGGGETAAVALERGTIVAYMAAISNMPALEGQGLELEEFDLGAFDLFPAANIVVPRDAVENDRDFVVGLLRGIAKGLEFGFANPEATIDLIEARSPDQVQNRAFAEGQLRWNLITRELPAEAEGRWGYNNQAGWEFYISFLQAGGQVPQGVSIDELYTNDLLPEANDFDASAIQADARDYSPS